MKLLFYSHYFAPSLGGVETIVLSLARGLAAVRAPDGSAEFDLTLVTETPAEEFDVLAFPFRIIRQPSVRQLLKMIRAADLIHIAGPALLPLLLGLLMRKSVVVEHHGFQTICPTGQLLIEPAAPLVRAISWPDAILNAYGAARTTTGWLPESSGY